MSPPLRLPEPPPPPTSARTVEEEPSASMMSVPSMTAGGRMAAPPTGPAITGGRTANPTGPQLSLSPIAQPKSPQLQAGVRTLDLTLDPPNPAPTGIPSLVAQSGRAATLREWGDQ